MGDKYLIRMVVCFIIGILLQFFIMDFQVNKLSLADYAVVLVVACLMAYVCIVLANFLNKHFGVYPSK